MLMLLALSSFALPPAPPLDFNFAPSPLNAMELCFPSGLKVHAVGRPTSETIAVTLVIDGGRAGESNDERGAAHFLEHLWFQARLNDENALWERESGVEFGGSTFTDATVYTIVGAA
ncbi:MAG: insulinase family protein, partial [Proteobacteria bacterium]|nr:insulinase family protein [Pseudomonadota bacterium]